MKIIKYLIFSFLILFSFVSKAGDPDLFYFVADDDNHLYSVDRVTEIVTDIGACGVGDIEAIAYYPIPGANQLFAANGGDFGTLNTSTGEYTFFAEIDGAGQMNGALGLQSVTDVDAMMLDGQTFKIWAAQRNSPNDLLFQIDPATGQIIRSAFGSGIDYIVVTGPGINVDVDDLGVSPVTGRMYASNNDGGNSDNLIEINKYNATYSVIAALGEDDIEGLAFHNDGTLYGSEGDADRMSEINITTGATTNQITLDGGDVEALAALVADANTISGTVYEDDDLDGTLDGGESGVEGVLLYLYIDVNGDGSIDPEDTRIQTTTTDSNGDYEFYYASTGNLLVSSEFSSYPASSALTTDNIEAAAFTDNVNFAETDANNNFGIGTGPDCDGDGLPNFFEGGNNSDLDAVLDSCDLDSDNDGILDSVEGIEDFDDDGIPNYRDRDSDDDGIPDAIEANRGLEPSGYSTTEGNVAGTDSDGNGIVDTRETGAGTGVMVSPNPDSDNDGNPDYLDLDSDNDGILDIIEAGGEDSDSDGQVDGLLDADSNGLDDRIESTPLAIPNTDETFEDANGLTNLPNFIDIDSDSDGIDDTREGYSTADYDFPTLLTDTDSDGIIDFWDVSTFSTPITPYDRDSDDIPDYIDDDSDNDGVSDLIEGNDADADGVVDVVLSGDDDDENGLDDALDGLCGQQTVYATVSDYAEEEVSDGTVDDNSGDLNLCDDGSTNQLVGIRFDNIDVSQGASITSAYVQFETDDVSTGEITITIQGELALDAAEFSDDDDDVSDRTTTVASVTWTPGDWTTVNENGTEQRTVDISLIIEEIVGQGSWSSGNALALIFSSPGGNTREAETDPLLIINTEFEAIPSLSFTAGDHAEEDNSDGSMYLSSSDLEMPNDGGTNQTIGILFPGVTLDQGQVVTSAYIQFQADGSQSTSITLSIEGELASTAVAYSSADNDVTNRNTTTATAVSWSPANWTGGDAGVSQQTPDLTNLVQEIVDQSGWANGNNMSFIITGPTGSGEFRRAETDPVLIIETTASFTICASNVAHQDFDLDGEDDFRDTDDDNDGIPTIAEIPDDDGSGTPDYLEFDGDECGIGFLLTGYTDDYTGVEESENGVVDENNFTDTPDGDVTLFNSNGDEYIIDFEQVYPAGYKYVITWSASEVGTAEIVIAESDDNSIYSGRQANQTTNSTTLFNDTITSQFDFQYIRFRLEDSSSDIEFEIDAVGVLVPTCDVDSDDDGIVDTDDIDDDNDGVLDVDEQTGCTPVAEAPSGAIVDDSGASGDFNDINDGDLSANEGVNLNAATEYIIIDLGSSIPSGTNITFTLWKSNDDNKTIRIAQLPNSTVDLGGGTNAQSIDDVSIAGGSSVTSYVFGLTMATQFVQIEMTSRSGGRIEVVEATVGAHSTGCVDRDTDGDGIDDRLDLDSDNDGIPDIQEAGGSDRDTDSDGRVDDPIDTDGDGWADDFDSDNGGTALDDEDQDSDGLENRLDLDADDDGIADIIEAGGEDNDGDGQVDDNTDTDNDGLADTFDNDSGGSPLPIADFDGDGIQNYLDLDSDSDGITDNVEGRLTSNSDEYSSTDFDNDGWDDIYDGDVTGGSNGTPIVLSNNDGFGQPDYLDHDSDGDGYLDYTEGFDDDEDGDALDDLLLRATNYISNGGTASHYVNGTDGNGTNDGDGIPDWLEDDDGDNVPNFLDPDSGFYHDDDEDGLINLYDTDDDGVASILPNEDGDAEPDFRDIDNSVALPIELLTFNAVKVGAFVEVYWITKTEINNDYFIVQKLKTSLEYYDIGMVYGAGNSNAELSYKLIDKHPIVGDNYYRLKQVDFDGTVSYSEIQVVKFDENYNSLQEFEVFPNPTNGYNTFIKYNGDELDNITVSVTSLIGQTLFTFNSTISRKGELIRIPNLYELSKGTYLINIISSKEVQTNKMIIK